MAESKKKALVAAVGVIAALALAIGGTLAYLQDTKTVDRTFTGGDHVKVSISPDTYQPEKIIPGKTAQFDPKVKVDNTVDAYAFVKVIDQTGLLGTTPSFASGWTKLSGYDDVFYREVSTSEANTELTVFANGTISFSNKLTSGDITGDRVVSLKAYAIQKEYIADAEMAWVCASTDYIPDSVTSVSAVTGNTKEQNGALITAAISAASGDDVALNLSEGTYAFPGVENKKVTLVGNGDSTVVDVAGQIGCSGSSITMINCKIAGDLSNTECQGLQHVTRVTYTDCTLTGLQTLYAEETVMTNCDISSNRDDGYALWTYGGEHITFDNCRFKSLDKSKAVLCYIEGGGHSFTRTFKNCTFEATGTAEKSAVMINYTANSGAKNSYVVSFEGCTAKGYGENDIEGVNGLVGLKQPVKDDITVTVDGKTVYTHTAS